MAWRVLYRLVQLPLASQDIAEVVMGIRHPGVELQGLPQVTRRLLCVPVFEQGRAPLYQATAVSGAILAPLGRAAPPPPASSARSAPSPSGPGARNRPGSETPPDARPVGLPRGHRALPGLGPGGRSPPRSVGSPPPHLPAALAPAHPSSPGRRAATFASRRRPHRPLSLAAAWRPHSSGASLDTIHPGP